MKARRSRPSFVLAICWLRGEARESSRLVTIAPSRPHDPTMPCQIPRRSGGVHWQGRNIPSAGSRTLLRRFCELVMPADARDATRTGRIRSGFADPRVQRGWMATEGVKPARALGDIDVYRFSAARLGHRPTQCPRRLGSVPRDDMVPPAWWPSPLAPRPSSRLRLRGPRRISRVSAAVAGRRAIGGG